MQTVNTSRDLARGTIVSPAGWHHADIVAGIRKRGSNLRSLSVAAGFAPSTLQASLYRLHPAAHRAIADFLGVSRHEIWPHWYDESDARRAVPLSPPSHSTAA